jgi:hypothetical protein
MAENIKPRAVFALAVLCISGKAYEFVFNEQITKHLI